MRPGGMDLLLLRNDSLETRTFSEMSSWDFSPSGAA